MLRRKLKAAIERARLLIEQAEALGEPPEDPLLLFSVLYGFWVAKFVAFDGECDARACEQFLTLAEKQRATVPLMIGHRLGQVPTAHRRHFGRARPSRSGFALYDPAEASSAGDPIWPGRRVATLSFRSLALWVLGYPEAALADTDRALKDAREIGQAPRDVCAVQLGSLLSHPRGNYSPAPARSMAHRLDRQKGRRVLGALATDPSTGLRIALTGNASDAVQTITAGIIAIGQRG